MGFWSYYFFAKLLMFGGGFIGFHVLENLLFAAFVALPVRRWVLKVGKQVVAIPVGVALLYHDTWLPPLRRVVAQGDQLADFSAVYLLDLIQRFINFKLVLALLLLLLVYWLLSRKLRMSSFAVLGILLAPFLGIATGVTRPSAGDAPATVLTAEGAAAGAPISSERDLDATLNAFYAREQQRRVRLQPVMNDDTPYDVLILQVCSLAWDDLEFVGQRQNPLLARFDLRFDNFNAAASYSGPAAIRLLRSTCGQPHHDALYKPADPGCYLMDALQGAGFDPQWAMNHNGVFGNMAADISVRGGLKAPLFPLTGFQPAMAAFDGSNYYGDYAVLSAWWKQRLRQDQPRVALYYNTGSLHDGNRFIGRTQPGVKESYRLRVTQLFDDLGRFFDDVQASGRRAVVIMVPEHGANVRGDRMQISGLRELPSPAIGLVPTGVKLIGAPGTAAQVQVTRPTSLFALGSLLAAFTANNPYVEGATPLIDLAQRLPETEYVAENDGTVVMRAGGRYWTHSLGSEWTEYSSGR